MPSNSVLFFPGVSVTVGAGGSPVAALTVATGALTAGVPASVAHSMGYTNYSFSVADATNIADVNQIYVDPAFPTTNFIIETLVDLPLGLNVTCLGW